MKRILENESLASCQALKEEIEEQIQQLTQETTEILLLAQIKEETSVLLEEAEEQERQSTSLAPTENYAGEAGEGEGAGHHHHHEEEGEEGDGGSSGGSSKKRGDHRATSHEEINLTSEDMREAESEVSEDVYAIYV